MIRFCAIVGMVSLAVPAAGCRFDPSGLPGDDRDATPPIDGDPPPDTPPGTPDAGPDPADAAPSCQWPRPPAHFDPCDLPAGAPVNLGLLGRYTYDTDTGVLTDPALFTSNPPSLIITQGGVQARVLATSQFSLGVTSTLRVVGSRPLIISSESSIIVNGIINAASQIDGLSGELTPGPGANPVACADSAAAVGEPAAGTNADQGGGGGGGGAFGGDGGDGGDGTGAAGGGKGTKVSLPDHLRGGCPGADGGNGDGATGGLAGSGGGALELAARTTVTITGTVHAGGSRGIRGLQGAAGGGAGAGGAGSGGMIFIDATTLDLFGGAVLAANGGGGGEGGDDNQDGNVNAQDGQPSATKASKGSGGANEGGDGGDGSAAGTIDGASAQTRQSGGGGGGGAGFIVFRTGTTNEPGGVTISPAETVP